MPHGFSCCYCCRLFSFAADTDTDTGADADTDTFMDTHDRKSQNY